MRLTGIIKEKDAPTTLISSNMINPTAELNTTFHNSFIGLRNNCAIKYNITKVNKAAITTLMTSMTISPYNDEFSYPLSVLPSFCLILFNR
jgi:hypothetical protein